MTVLIGYPFLISRNYNQDYRVVYAPSFFQAPELAGILIDATGSSVETGDYIFLTTILNLTSSTLPSKLLYRVIPSKKHDIGDDSAGEITDNVGRTIYHIEGILIDKGIELHANLIDGNSFSRLVHGPLMVQFSEFWHHIPKRGITEPDLVVPLSSLINNQIIEVKNIDEEERKLNHWRTFRNVIGLVSIVAISALVLAFYLDRKQNHLDAKITEIFQRKYNIVSINTKFTELGRLTKKYHYKSWGTKQLNCIALNRIISNKAYSNNLKLFPTNIKEIASKNRNVKFDPTNIEGIQASCEKKMKNPLFAAKQYFEFLQH